MSNQGKLLKILSYLGLSFVKSLPWFVIETHGSKLSMSFYLFIAIMYAKISSVYMYRPLGRIIRNIDLNVTYYSNVQQSSAKLFHTKNALVKCW